MASQRCLRQVTRLCEALQEEASRAGAVDAIRGLVDAIVLEPDDDQLKVLLKGNLAGMLGAAGKRSPETGDAGAPQPTSFGALLGGGVGAALAW
jgi:hypothetical protein